MHDNQTRIPCGEYPIFVDNSTKAWVELKCVGRIRINSKDDIRVLPNETKNTAGYPVKTVFTELMLGSPQIELKQITSDKRSFTLFNPSIETGPDMWKFTTSSWRSGDSRNVVMYQQLELVLRWLQKTFKK